MESGHRVYYVVGNHDIQLEHFLESWIFTSIVPFLNVRSGDSRIRIEHGHLYDPWYTRSPGFYEVMTRVVGVGRFVVADAYSLFARSQAMGGRRSKRSDDTAEPYRRGAEIVLERGFDTVIFGHTHRSDDVRLAAADSSTPGTGCATARSCASSAARCHWRVGVPACCSAATDRQCTAWTAPSSASTQPKAQHSRASSLSVRG